MRELVAIAIGLALTGICGAKDFEPFEGEKPIAVLIQSDPWAMVIGSDTPRVAIYENGDVIFKKRINDQSTYQKVTLNKRELKAVQTRLNTILSLRSLKSSYNLRPTWTDQPTTQIYSRNGNREITTSVYGLTCSSASPLEDTQLSRPSSPNPLPKELVKTHKWLCDLDHPRSKTWVPAYVEVMLWDYAYAPESSIQWPTGWPSLNSSRAVERKDAYSLFLNGSLLPELRSFLATRKPKGAIEISEKKMAASYRLVFPSEPVWREAFRTAAKQSKAD